MAGKVLSIEVGYSFTKVCELDYQSKKPKIYNSFVLPTPDDILADGMLTVDEGFVAAFKEKLAEKKIKTKTAVFTISSSKIATREVKIPCHRGSNSYVPRARGKPIFRFPGTEGREVSFSLLNAYRFGNGSSGAGSPAPFSHWLPEIYFSPVPKVLMVMWQWLPQPLQVIVIEPTPRGTRRRFLHLGQVK